MRMMMKNAKYRWIPCWFDEETHEIMGKNWYYDVLIELNIWFDFSVLKLDELPIWIED